MPYHAQKNPRKIITSTKTHPSAKRGSGPAIGSRGTQVIVRSFCPATDICRAFVATLGAAMR